jgi:Protein of unknown function (DUF1493)
MGPDDELVERVREFVAVKTGWPLGKVSLEAALARDIGMAGDDAVEFFEEFAREFGVPPETFSSLDFTHQFGDEGLRLGTGCSLLFTFSFFGFLLGAWANLPSGLVLVGSFALTLGVASLYRKYVRRHRDNQEPIRVSDLVEAATRKRWGFPRRE